MSLETFLAEFQRQQGLEVNISIIVRHFDSLSLNWHCFCGWFFCSSGVAHLMIRLDMLCRSPCFHSGRVFYMQSFYLAKSCRTECHSLWSTSSQPLAKWLCRQRSRLSPSRSPALMQRVRMWRCLMLLPKYGSISKPRSVSFSTFVKNRALLWENCTFQPSERVFRWFVPRPVPCNAKFCMLGHRYYDLMVKCSLYTNCEM